MNNDLLPLYEIIDELHRIQSRVIDWTRSEPGQRVIGVNDPDNFAQDIRHLSNAIDDLELAYDNFCYERDNDI